MNCKSRDLSRVLVCLVLAAVTLGTFWPATRCDFVNYDDGLYVTENVQVQKGLTWETVQWAFLNPVAGHWHPVTMLSHMADCQLFGLQPRGHHLTSVLLHVLNTMLVFLLLHRLTGAVWRSAFVAVLFGWHPMRVESVAWVAERKDVLSALFFMLTLWAYAKHVTSARCQVTGGSRNFVSRVTCHGSRHYWLALAFFALGLMSKAMLVTLPCVLLLLDYWPLRRMGFGARLPGAAERSGDGSLFNPQLSAWRPLLLEKVPFFLLSAGCSMIALYAARIGGAVIPTHTLPIDLRVENALIAYARYMGKTFWPVDLAVFYPYPLGWRLWEVFGSGAVLAVVFVLVVRFAKSRPYLLVGWFWFVGMLVPVIGLVQAGSQSMADRYTYAPLIGVFVALVWLAGDVLATKPPDRWMLWAAAVAVLLGCMVTTREQLRHWENTEKLFEHALRVTRNNEVAHGNLALVRSRQGRSEEAIAHFTEAIRINPGFADAYNGLGGVLLGQGKVEEALPHLKRALELRPNFAAAYYNLGLALRRQGKPTEAAENFETALRLNPGQADAHNNLGAALLDLGKIEEALAHLKRALEINPGYTSAHHNLGCALARRNQLEEAIAHYREALRLKPNWVEPHHHLGLALAQQGRFADAEAEFQQALEHGADPASAHCGLGRVCAAQGKSEAAIGHFREALRLQPDGVLPLNDLAWLLATQAEARYRDGGEAIRLAERAVAVTRGRDAGLLDTLAAAYAEAGRYAEAEKTGREALALAQAAGQAALAGQIETRCSGYARRQPWREP